MTRAGVLHPAPVGVRQFLYTESERKFVGEISDTNGLGRVWPDSCDSGLTVVGLTGREMVFVVQHIEYRDGDLLWWRLTSIEDGYTMILFND